MMVPPVLLCSRPAAELCRLPPALCMVAGCPAPQLTALPPLMLLQMLRRRAPCASAAAGEKTKKKKDPNAPKRAQNAYM